MTANLSSALENDSKRTVTVPSIASTDYTYFVMPTCHWEAISNIVLNGSIPVYSAFVNKGTQVLPDGVEYTFIESEDPGGYSQGDTLVVS